MDLLRDPPLFGSFGYLKIIESPYLTVTRPHAMSSERTLARVAGGRWFPKTSVDPSPDLLCTPGGTIYGHPETIARLRKKLEAS